MFYSATGSLNSVFLQEIEAQDFQIFELREALERSREDSKRLNMLNMIHMDTAICRDVSQPTVADTACSPIPPHLETRGDVGTRDHGNQEIPSRDLVEVGVNTSFVFEDDISQHPHKVREHQEAATSRGFFLNHLSYSYLIHVVTDDLIFKNFWITSIFSRISPRC